MPRTPHGADHTLTAPAKVWTVSEANARLDAMREILPKLRAWVVRLRKVHDELHRLAAFWGAELESPDHPDRELKQRLDDEWQTLTRRLETEVAALQEEGIEVKDIDSGLIDFYSVLGGEVVFLCWQRGEESVAYFHPLDGGYRTRQPLFEGPKHPATRAHRES